MFVMGNQQVTTNQKVSMMIKKPITDPEGCSSDIMAMLDTLDVLGGKWKLLIIHYLSVRQTEINTFNKIENDIQGISAKILSKELKILEANHIVHREVMQTKPITVQYTVTAYGKETAPLIAALVNWGQQHRTKLIAEQRIQL